MKLHRLHIENLLGARQIDLPIEQPITLIAGANGAGKSSVRDAIGLALAADLCRVAKKGDAAALISEGASSARVFVQTDATSGRDYEVSISKSGKIADSAAGVEPPPALPFVLDPARFARLADTERRAFLFQLLGIETRHTAICERLARKGLDEKKVDAVLPILGAGFSAGEKHAKEQASQARGAWKVISGEPYGSQKAEGWAPPAVDAPHGDAAQKAQNAEAQLKAVESSIAHALQELGAARQADAARREAAARIERLRDQAGMIERIKARLATADENVQNCRAQLAAVGGEDPKAPGNYLLRALASVTADALDVLVDQPGHDGLKARMSAHLAEYSKLHGDPNADPGDPVRSAEIRRGLQTAGSGAANARRDLAAAEAAASELAKLEKARQADAAAAPGLDAIEARIAGLTELRDKWQADARKYLDLAGAAERRARQAADAARHHADVKQWSAIAEALSPDGIQAEMIAEALNPLNAHLAEHAALAQWQPVRIGADMAITVGGRLYGLCSESERWRADALLALTVAQLSGLRFVVLDRLDVLDATGREDALYWLSDVANAGQLDTAIVLATLKSAPPAQALPPHIDVRWIERGSITAARDPAMRGQQTE